jgi:putative FmdB family regulatory protein
MPIYEFKCSECNHEFDKIFKMNEVKPIQECSKCKGVAYKQISASSSHFKGTGFYKTDYK